MFRLYHIRLETRQWIFSAEVGVDGYTDDAIEFFYIWLVVSGVEDEYIVNHDATFNGICIGSSDTEGVLEDTVSVCGGWIRPVNSVSFRTWFLMNRMGIQRICMCDCHRVGLSMFYHCWDGGCCEYEDESYLLTPTKVEGIESARIAMREKGVFDDDLYWEMLRRRFKKPPKRKARR